LQQRAQSTGKEATAEVSSNMNVVGMYGVRNSTSTDIWNLHVYMTLSAGAVPIDLNQTVVRYGDGSQDLRNYKHNDFANYGFTLAWIRGNGVGAVADTGDLIDLNFTMIDTTLPPRTDFTVQVLNAVGSPMVIDVRTPPTYAADTQILLK
jgi:flagellin FlaB